MNIGFYVVDCEFNRAHYASLIGQFFFSAPSYATVQCGYLEDGIFYGLIDTPCRNQLAPASVMDGG